MRSIRAFALVILGWLAVGSTAFADVQVSIHGDGRISIIAKGATAGQILAEWAKVGQTQVVNGEKIPREPLTIQLENVSEDEALGIVLRAASGYLAAPRAVAVPNASRFDRIIVMPPSIAPPQPSASSASAVPRAAAVNVPAAAYPTASAQPVYQSSEYPQEPPPIATPQPAYESAGDAAGGDEGPSVMVVGGAVTPTAIERAQISLKARRALETVDPREFQLPKELQGGAAATSPVGRPGGVAFPGMIIQPPAQPPKPGQPPSRRD
jgi:hypothetical protein